MSAYVDATGVTQLTADIKELADTTYPSNEAVAPEYDSTSSYGVGDYCIYGGLLYKCNIAISTGGETWDATHWTQVNIVGEIGGGGSSPGMTLLSYGSSTWNEFIAAYKSNTIVYCRASSNSNPASGSQTRLAFMAYVNNAENPTEVEFQYYRSVSSHSASQQGDQVFVYKLAKTSGWSVTTREAMSKIVAGTGLTSSYSNGVLTLSLDVPSASGVSF